MRYVEKCQKCGSEMFHEISGEYSCNLCGVIKPSQAESDLNYFAKLPADPFCAPPQPKIHFIHSDTGDWTGMYIDGKLAIEGHKVTAKDVLDALGYKYTQECHYEDYFEDNGGGCPKTLEKNNEK